MSISVSTPARDVVLKRKRTVTWLAGFALVASTLVVAPSAVAEPEPDPEFVTLTVKVVDETDPAADPSPGIEDTLIEVTLKSGGSNLCLDGDSQVLTNNAGEASCEVPSNEQLTVYVYPPTEEKKFLQPDSFDVTTGVQPLSREVATIEAPSGSRTISGTLRTSSPSVTLGPGKNVNLLYRDDDYGFAFWDVTTDADGRFSFTGLAPAGYVLQTSADDHLYWFADVTLGSVDLVVNPTLLGLGSLVIEGDVFVNGTEDGIEDVEVVAYLAQEGSAQSSWSASATTNDDGRFVITGVPSGRVTLYVSDTPEGYFDQWADITVNTAAGVLSHTFFLEPLPSPRDGSISGTVFDDVADDNGNPGTVLGATVYLSYSQGERGYFKSVVTGADGSYGFSGLWAGQYWLWVNCDEPCSGLDSAWASVRVTDSDKVRGRDFTLKTLPTGNNTLELTFQDQADVKIDGLDVSLQNRSFTSIWRDGATDSDGKVVLTGLPAGNYSVWPQTYDYDLERQTFKNLPWGQENVTVGVGVTSKTFTLERIDYDNASRISGTLVDTRTGSPVPGANVSLSSDSIFFNTIVGPDGSWEFAQVPSGEYFIFVGAPEFDDVAYNSIFQELTVPENQELTLNLQTQSILPGTGSVTVTTRNKVDHRRISGETVFLYHSTANYYQEGQTANGSFVFSDLPPGIYYLQADSNEFLFDEGFEVEVGQTGNTNVTFRGESLNRTGTVSGKVVDDSGEGLQGAYVSIGVMATSEGEETPFPRWVSELFAYTDDAGNYELTRVPVGREIQIEVDVSFGADAERPGGLVPFSERFTLTTANPTLTKNVAMVPGGVISGVVTVAGGSTAQGLWATAFDFDTFNWLSSAPVLGDGSFEIERLRATTGEERVVVLFEDFRRSGPTIQNAFYASSGLSTTPAGAEKLQVTSGQETTLDPRELALGGTIQGTVSVLIDGEDAELPRGRWVYVEVLDTNDDVVEFVGGYADGFSSGQYSIRGLAPGDYTLRFIDGLSFWGGFGEQTERRLYGTVESETPVTVTAGGTATFDQQMSATRPDELPADVPVINTVDEEGDLEGGIDIPDSLGIGAQTSIQLPSEMAGEWVLVVANSDPQFLSDEWVQVAADGQVTVTLPAGLRGSHQIAVQDAGEQLVGWAQVSITDNPSPSPRTSKKVKVIPAEEIEQVRQWVQNPVGPKPTVGEEPESLEVAEAEPDQPVTEPTEQAPPAANSTDDAAPAAATSPNGMGTLLWWVLGILVAVGAITALVLIARRRLV